MGNNHNQYFGKDKRKIIVLGLEDAGKTSKIYVMYLALVNYIVSEKINFNTQKTKSLNIVDKKLDSLQIAFFVTLLITSGSWRCIKTTNFLETTVLRNPRCPVCN